MRFLKKYKRAFLTNNFGRFYYYEDYALVLKYVPSLFGLKRREEVLCNIYRILSLKKLGHKEWEHEFTLFRDNGFLNIFNDDERYYLHNMMTLELFDELDVTPARQINLENVAKHIRRFLPQRNDYNFLSLQLDLEEEA